MSDDTFENCVQPFFTTRGFPHWGLGLSAAYYAAAAHGGGLVLTTRFKTVVWKPSFCFRPAIPEWTTGENRPSFCNPLDRLGWAAYFNL